jgi:hypothetical protein
VLFKTWLLLTFQTLAIAIPNGHNPSPPVVPPTSPQCCMTINPPSGLSSLVGSILELDLLSPPVQCASGPSSTSGTPGMESIQVSNDLELPS